MVRRQTVAQAHRQFERLIIVHCFEGSTHTHQYIMTDQRYLLLSDKLLEENLADLQRHEQEHRERVAFTYTVMNPAETECLGCIYIGPLERLLGQDGESGEYLSDRTAYVSFWVRHSRLADHLDRRLLQALMPWFQNEWAFLHVLFIVQRVEERQIRLYEEMGLRLLYSLKPHQPFLDVVLAYLLEPNPL